MVDNNAEFYLTLIRVPGQRDIKRVSMMKVSVEHWSLGPPSWNYLAPALLNIGVARPNYSYL